jgi:hypothetical protein
LVPAACGQQNTVCPFGDGRNEAHLLQ